MTEAACDGANGLVFPEMGYTCEQDKRALDEKKIAPVYSGVTDNRSRVAEGNFCHE